MTDYEETRVYQLLTKAWSTIEQLEEADKLRERALQELAGEILAIKRHLHRNALHTGDETEMPELVEVNGMLVDRKKFGY